MGQILLPNIPFEKTSNGDFAPDPVQQTHPAACESSFSIYLIHNVPEWYLSTFLSSRQMDQHLQRVCHDAR